MSKLKLIADEQRKKMLVTNLYAPENVYEINNTKLNKVLSIIGTEVLGGSFDFSNSIAGRILLPNTPLQKIANRELSKALLSRVTSELKSNVIGSIDIKKGNINTPNFWSITKIKEESNTDKFSKLLDTLFGYQTLENPLLGNYSNENLKNLRGDGTKNAYEVNILRNKFNDITDNNKYISNSDIGHLGGLKPNVGNELIDKTKKLTTGSLAKGYPQKNTNESDIISNSLDIDAKAYNTNYKDTDGFLVYNPNPHNENVSKGSNVRNSDNTFCRSWTVANGYTGYTQAMKFDNYVLRNIPNMVQGDSIIPNIAPVKNSTGVVKNLMFSIENLAYEGDALKGLKAYEKGNNGRIMWFPPYGISLTEGIAPKISSIDLLGRNEPMYTYNGVERTINLSFTLIVDAPSVIRHTEDSNNELARLFSGCKDFVKNPDKGLSENEKLEIEINKIIALDPPPIIEVQAPENPYPLNKSLKFYYSNDKYSFNSDINGPKEDNQNNTGKDSNTSFLIEIDKLVKFMTDKPGYENYKIVVKGYASSLSDNAYNKVLAYKRAYSTYIFIRDQIVAKNPKVFNNSVVYIPEVTKTPESRVAIKDGNSKYIKLLTYGETKAINKNATKYTLNEDVIDRYTEVYLEFSVENKVKTDKIDPIVESKKQEVINKLDKALTVNNLNVKTQGAEEFYFETLKKEDPYLFTQYKQKLKYFNPVFHSQTPEDFNSRLNFLHQCTRQGAPQGDEHGQTSTNSIFGKPPISILRLGDFIHTRIVIDSISLTYEPLIWDLNPEGIGIQPMLCNVVMSAKVIGGQSLKGPINRLLNALDHNFYANTEVYDKKALDTVNSYPKTTNAPTENKSKSSENPPTTDDKDQVARTENQDVGNTVSKPIGSVISDHEISYTTIMSEKTGILTNWVEYFINLDEKYFKYLSNGILDTKVASKDKSLNSVESIGRDLTLLLVRYHNNNKLLDIRDTRKDKIEGMDGYITLTDDLNFESFKLTITELNDILVNDINKINSKNITVLKNLKIRIVKLKKQVVLQHQLQYTI